MVNQSVSNGLNNPANRLIDWMGLKQTGIVDDLCEALNYLKQSMDDDAQGDLLDYGQIICWMKDLSALGFCEFDDESGTWEMSPSSLIRLPGTGGMTVFTGYRPRNYRWVLAECNMLVHDQFPVQFSNGFPMPDTVLLQARNMDIIYKATEKLCADYLGIHAVQLAEALSTPQLEILSFPADLPKEYSVAMFSEGEWLAVPGGINDVSPHEEGLYKVRDGAREEFYFRLADRWIHCDFENGTILEATRLGRGKLRRDRIPEPLARNRKVIVGKHVHLPFSHRRVLIQCSGRLPEQLEESGQEVFHNVSTEVYKRVRDTLPGQETLKEMLGGNEASPGGLSR